MKTYTDIDALRGILLEESYVLDVVATMGRVSFRLDFVLTPEHPRYAAPAPGEQFCFRTGSMEFREVTRLTWANQGAPPAIDANDELDYGGIDLFEFDDVGYVMEGSWGRIDLVAKEVVVEMD